MSYDEKKFLELLGSIEISMHKIKRIIYFILSRNCKLYSVPSRV
jgi:hypothetical protein